MSPKAKTLARRLLRENRGTRSKEGRSWRVIAREDYNDQINNATLCRFAISQGEWIPKDERLQIVLGLKHPRKACAHVQDIFDMPTATLLWKLTHREPMPPMSQQRAREIKRTYAGAR